MTRVVVVGIPRSGTTWVATMLAHARRTALLAEPDNHHIVPFALRAKRRLPGGFHTALAPQVDAPLYERLWREALGEHGSSCTCFERAREAGARRLLNGTSEFALRRSFMRPASVNVRLRAAELLAIPRRPPALPQNLIVKSVYATLSINWLAARLGVQVVVVVRDLLNVMSSWIDLGWHAAHPEADELAVSDPELLESFADRYGLPAMPLSAAARLAWFLGLLRFSLERDIRSHPDWHVARHEELTKQPSEHFPALAADLGLQWGPEADAALAASNVAGSGFAIEREAASLQGVWRTRLSQDLLSEVADTLGEFPMPLGVFSPQLLAIRNG